MPPKKNVQDGGRDKAENQEPAVTHQEMAPGMAALLQVMQQQATRQQQRHEEQQRRHKEEQLPLCRQHHAEMLQMMGGGVPGRGRTRADLPSKPRQQDSSHREVTSQGRSPLMMTSWGGTGSNRM